MRPKALIATVGLALLPSISLAQDFADRPARRTASRHFARQSSAASRCWSSPTRPAVR